MTESTTDVLDLDEQMRRCLPGATEAVRACLDAGVTVGVAESFTAGAVTLALAVVPDSGEVLQGGTVAYQSEVKFDALDVPEGPVVTAQAAVALARGAARLHGSGLGVGTTGVAGPATQEGRPVGTAFVAVAANAGPAWCRSLHLDGTPGEIRTQGAQHALDLLTEVAALWDDAELDRGTLPSAVSRLVEGLLHGAAAGDDEPEADAGELERAWSTYSADRTNGESTPATARAVLQAARRQRVTVIDRH